MNIQQDNQPTKVVRPIVRDKITTHFAWTVCFRTNGVPDRKQGQVSVARVAKELGLTDKRALKEAESLAGEAAKRFMDSLKEDGNAHVSYTVQSWCDFYFPNKLANQADEKYAYASHNAVKLHVYPTLGSVKLKDLNWKQLEAWWADLCSMPFAAPIYNKQGQVVGRKTPIILKWKTTDHIRQRLTQALDAAVARGLIPANPAKTLSANRKQRKAYLEDLKSRKRWLTVEELKKLLGASKGTPFYGPILLQTNLALRVGEACGLRICDVDSITGFVSTVNQLQRRASEYGGAKTLELGPPKGDGFRVAMASPELLEFIEQRLLEELAKNKSERCDFVCLFNGQKVDPNYIVKGFKLLCQTQGIDLGRGNSTHAIRRTILNLMKNAPGLSAEMRSFIAGHDRTDTTLIYDIERFNDSQKQQFGIAAKYVQEILAA